MNEERVEVKTLPTFEAGSLAGASKVHPDYASPGNTYSAILSRNEAVKDAKRLKTFLELRDKYVRKKVLFEDPLFPANNTSLFKNRRIPLDIKWKRPSVGELCPHKKK